MQKLGEFFNEQKRPDAASVGQRIGAYLIDAALVAVFIAICTGVVVVFDMKESETALIIVTVLVFIIGIGYLFIRDGFDGQGIGKRIMKIQVIHLKDNQPIGFGRSALRMLVIRLIGGIIELIILVIQPNKRRAGDWLANTVVLKKK